MKSKVIMCPICGEHRFASENDHEICRICGWENEGFGTDGFFPTGANHVSFHAYKMRYRFLKRIDHTYRWISKPDLWNQIDSDFEWLPAPVTTSHVHSELSMDSVAHVAWFYRWRGDQIVRATYEGILEINISIPRNERERAESVYDSIKDEIRVMHAAKDYPDMLDKFADEIKERYKPFLVEWDGTFD